MLLGYENELLKYLIVFLGGAISIFALITIWIYKTKVEEFQSILFTMRMFKESLSNAPKLNKKEREVDKIEKIAITTTSIALIFFMLVCFLIIYL